MKKFELMPYRDPYDLWATKLGQKVRIGFYNGRFSSKLLAAAIAACELLLPITVRRIIGAKKQLHPIAVSQYIILAANNDWIDEKNVDFYIKKLLSQAAVNEPNKLAFGLGFVWVSKNGTYSPSEPFVTHTPYAIEALLALLKIKKKDPHILKLFANTWSFLESLIVMDESNDTLALSYAPVPEPRIVVNANSYAALCYALHIVHNPNCDSILARQKVKRLVNWVLSKQSADGSWLYYADSLPGNFIDCFHSCFVIKNLLKVQSLLTLEDTLLDEAINKGVYYIIDQFYKNEVGLVSRFTVEDIKDPYKFILYDQAEFIGILLDTGRIDFAKKLIEKVEVVFKKNDVYFSQIDFLGRKVGKEYMRWGVIPYLLQLSRFNTLRKEKCVE